MDAFIMAALWATFIFVTGAYGLLGLALLDIAAEHWPIIDQAGSRAPWLAWVMWVLWPVIIALAIICLPLKLLPRWVP